MAETRWLILCMMLTAGSTCVSLEQHAHARHGHAAVHKLRLPLALTSAETQLLADYLKSSSFYFEYGTGGSTGVAQLQELCAMRLL